MHLYLDDDPKKEQTRLEKGDVCSWHKDHGTVAFHRGGTRLKHNGDDKFLVRPLSLGQFAEIMNMVAAAAGLTAELRSAGDGIVMYEFV